MVKIFTMVKDEVDIVKDWIVYHGSLFGWNNIYILDNYSTDGTYEIIQEFAHLGINIFREDDYRFKGYYMSALIKEFCQNERFAFPIDIDEFIVYYDTKSKEIKIDKKFIINYFNTLPRAILYKANYLFPILTSPEGSKRATAEIDYASYFDYGIQAKSFMDPKLFKGIIDHGNHIPTKDFFLTNIVLIHFHDRNMEQIKKKSINNVTGLGYSTDIKELREKYELTPYCEGNHHIKKLIDIHDNKYHFNYNENVDPKGCISIKLFKQRIIDGPF